MFIDVIKVSKDNKAKDGTRVSNPVSGERVPTKWITALETIRKDEIKSARPWDKTAEQEVYIDGPVTKLYMHGDKTRDSRPEILIQEDYNSFAQRLDSVRLNVEQG